MYDDVTDVLNIWIHRSLSSVTTNMYTAIRDLERAPHQACKGNEAVVRLLLNEKSDVTVNKYCRRTVLY